MHIRRKQRLQVVLAIVVAASVITALVVYALRDNLNLFYPPNDIAQGLAPKHKRIRAGGMVLKSSIKRLEDGLTVEFVLTDYKATLPVRYKGILPDLFAEEEGAVVAGKLDDNGWLIADEVLAKHDENYMPPELSDMQKPDAGR